VVKSSMTLLELAVQLLLHHQMRDLGIQESVFFDMFSTQAGA
jgi:hypothetical protein